MKAVPRDWAHADMLTWMPWTDDRTLPFSMAGANGKAWVKVLSWDPATGAESLLYKLEPGWSAGRIVNTVPEDLIVWHGEFHGGEHSVGKYGYSYRPKGYEVGPCSAPVGATIVAFCGAPDEQLYSKIPIPAVDTEAMPWQRTEGQPDTARFYWKPLRGDEESLDVFRLARATAGSSTTNLDTHEGMGAIEEGFFFEAGNQPVYEAWAGRLAVMNISAGTYVCHGVAAHGGSGQPNTADMLCFKHDGYSHGDDVDPVREELLAMFPKVTPAVAALREGRDPGLPARNF